MLSFTLPIFRTDILSSHYRTSTSGRPLSQDLIDNKELYTKCTVRLCLMARDAIFPSFLSSAIISCSRGKRMAISGRICLCLFTMPLRRRILSAHRGFLRFFSFDESRTGNDAHAWPCFLFLAIGSSQRNKPRLYRAGARSCCKGAQK